MVIDDKVHVKSLDGLTDYGVGKVRAVGNAYIGGVSIVLPGGTLLESGFYDVNIIPVDKVTSIEPKCAIKKVVRQKAWRKK